MKIDTFLHVIRSAGLLLLIGAIAADLYANRIAATPNASDQLMDLSTILLYLSGGLIVVFVRAWVFGLPLRKRITRALLYSTFANLCIFYIPAFWAFSSDTIDSRSDMAMGIMFAIIDFTLPCILVAVVLASIPLFDRKKRCQGQFSTNCVGVP